MFHKIYLETGWQFKYDVICVSCILVYCTGRLSYSWCQHLQMFSHACHFSIEATKKHQMKVIVHQNWNIHTSIRSQEEIWYLSNVWGNCILWHIFTNSLIISYCLLACKFVNGTRNTTMELSLASSTFSTLSDLIN